MTKKLVSQSTLTQDELGMLIERIDDPDWDISQQNDVWEILPRLVSLAQENAAYRELYRLARVILEKVHTLRVEYDPATSTSAKRKDLKESLKEALERLDGK